MPDLSVRIGTLEMRNPVMCASGTFGYGIELAQSVEFERIGAIVTKTVTRKMRPGNPMPRLCETPSGMLNAIGLQNTGVDVFMDELVPQLAALPTAIVASVAGVRVEDYAHLASRLDAADGIDGIEANFSCPNVESGLIFAQSPKELEAAVRAMREKTKKPLIAKLSPNVTDITEPARAGEAGGADAVSLINTFLGMAIDVERREPALANVTGGVSGPAIRPMAVRMVWEVARAVSIPVIGIGGITCAEDALQFLIAGACAVQVGTATYVKPTTAVETAEGIASYLERHGVSSVGEIVGTLKVRMREDQ